MRRIIVALFLILVFAATELEAKEITVNFVGDIMLSREIAHKIEIENDRFWPFRNIASILARADYVFGNLECVLNNENIGYEISEENNIFVASEEAGQGLKYAGINLVSLANNHTLDLKKKGVLETLRILNKIDIRAVGIYKKSMEYDQRLLFAAFIVTNNKLYQIDVNKGNEIEVSKEKVSELIEAGRRARRAVIVSLHWGGEFCSYPTQEQIDLAHFLVDAGANIIVGHHPHQLQGLEFYEEGLIAYSLGNFIFDQKYTETQKSMILKCVINDNNRITKCEIIPVELVLYDYQTKIADKNRAREILDEVIALSNFLNKDRLFYKKISTAKEQQ